MQRLPLAPLFLLGSAMICYAAPTPTLAEIAGEANNEFALKLLRHELASKPSTNVVFSPVSISLVGTMMRIGTGDVADPLLRKLLCQYDTDPFSMWKAWGEVLSSSEIKLLGDAGYFRSSNAIWLHRGATWDMDRMTRFLQVFRTEFRIQDLQDGRVMPRVNEWVSKASAGRIPKLIDREPAELLTLYVNATTFDARWDRPFEQSLPLSFGIGAAKRDVPGMSKVAKFRTIDNSSFRAIELPYNFDATMEIVIPAEDASLSDTLKHPTLDGAPLSWPSQATERTLRMPKWKHNWSSDLMTTFKQLLGDKYDEFSPDTLTKILFGREPHGVSLAMHQSVIDVNEEGTSAAAATAAGIDRAWGKAFDVDRPFLYFIRLKSTGLILFCGAVNQPN